ncbi:MAG: hypothetical protein ABI175_15715 [Polyangiales bacterium]
MLTRFVASGGAPRDPIASDPATVEDVRCIVNLQGAHGIHELVIATELGGGIRVLDGREGLAHRAKAQLAFHDVASGRTLDLRADELFVFDLQTIEMLPDAPGLNDALYLYGAIRGPYPQVLGAPVCAVDGQLTVTRSDLLRGLVDGVANAFSYAPDAHGSRCVHALLPGERGDVIDGGRGIVLALPLTPGWLLDSPVPNDLVAAQLLYDVLSALRADVRTPPIATPLPVPSRPALERALIAAGWKITGNEATRPKGKGLIGSVLSGTERRVLPREGTLDELVADARSALANVPLPPTLEAAAIARRMGPPGRITPTPPPIPPPRPRAKTLPPPIPAAAAPRPRVETPPTEWMKDFVDAHRAPPRPAPRVMQPARVVSRDPVPSWMSDFDTSDEDPG